MPLVHALKDTALATREIWWRTARRGRTTRLTNWRYPVVADQFLVQKFDDLRSVDLDQAHAYYLGHFTFGDDSVDTQSASPFAVSPPSDDWHDALHGFVPKRGTGTAISEAKLQMELADIRQTPLYQIFLDLKKAYDTLDRPRTLQILKG